MLPAEPRRRDLPYERPDRGEQRRRIVLALIDGRRRRTVQEQTVDPLLVKITGQPIAPTYCITVSVFVSGLAKPPRLPCDGNVQVAEQNSLAAHDTQPTPTRSGLVH